MMTSEINHQEGDGKINHTKGDMDESESAKVRHTVEGDNTHATATPTNAMSTVDTSVT